MTIGELLLSILTVAYGSIAVVTLIGYWPTIKDLYVHRKASANVSSYIVWSATSMVSFLYSIFILPDVLFRFVSGINVTLCLIILILSLKLDAH